MIILSVEENSTIAHSGLNIDDVIVRSEGDTITTIEDLMKSYQNNNWKGRLNLKVIRNQREISIILITK
ncbi:MAG: PDZ domain-containing protein [Maribacter sp.]|nr:PDZ domain-containing protein [Maribacter sp.]